MDIEITLTDRHIAGLCIAYGYTETNTDGTANEISPLEFATSKIVAFIEEVVSSVEISAAVSKTREEKIKEIDKKEKPIVREKLR